MRVVIKSEGVAGPLVKKGVGEEGGHGVPPLLIKAADETPAAAEFAYGKR